MKAFIKIKNSRFLSGSTNQMIHEDENGKLYVGPPIEADANKLIVVEITNEPMEDGYYHIIRVIKN